MTAIKDLFSSERGFFALTIVIAATVLTALTRMTIDQWTTFVELIFGTYVGGKTVTSAVALLKGATPENPAVPAPAATPPLVIPADSATITKITTTL